MEHNILIDLYNSLDFKYVNAIICSAVRGRTYAMLNQKAAAENTDTLRLRKQYMNEYDYSPYIDALIFGDSVINKYNTQIRPTLSLYHLQKLCKEKKLGDYGFITGVNESNIYTALEYIATSSNPDFAVLKSMLKKHDTDTQNLTSHISIAVYSYFRACEPLPKLNISKSIPWSSLSQDAEAIEEINICSHSGVNFMKGHIHREALLSILDAGITVKLLISEPKFAQNTYSINGSHQNLGLSSGLAEALPSFESCAMQWKKTNDEQKHLTVRQFSMPIYHRTYIIRYKNGDVIVSVRFHCYGAEQNEDTNTLYFLSNEDPDNADLYLQEFKMMWAAATSI